MKHFIALSALLFTAAASGSGTGTPSTHENEVTHVYQTITDHALSAKQSCTQLSKAITDGSVAHQKKQFETFITHWKTVESEYILGEFESDMIDTPRYLDVFHYNSNQPIQPQLKKHLNKKTTADEALFKNAFKSVNALEYILYTHPKSDVQQSYLKNITQSICEHLGEIHQGYISQKSIVLSNPEKFESVLLNTLIDSSYKLKEWRIADVIGQSKKYKNKFDTARAEYADSRLSMKAIQSILTNHKIMMGKQGLLSNLLKNKKNQHILNSIDAELEHALTITEQLKQTGFNQTHEAQLKQLHHHVKAVQKAYYEHLLGTLDITSKILEADGD